jgi:hypothetical protein
MIQTAAKSRGKSVLVSKIRAIGDNAADRLLEAGILTTRDLLMVGRTPVLREAVAARSGIHPSQVLRWVLCADLARIDGVGWEFAELLEQCGVCSPEALSGKDPNLLLESFKSLKKKGRAVGRFPSLYEIQSWVEQAGKLPGIIVY